MILKSKQKILNLPITERYSWKFRNVLLEQPNTENIKLFIHQKKRHLLSSINVSDEDLETDNLLNHLLPPELMKDLFIAANRIVTAIKKNEKITVFGDYDVDGTTSCAMMAEFFSALNYPVDIYIPDRMVEGYGLNPIGLENCAKTGTKVLITVDNGISSVSACNLAKQYGIDVIITDHHDLPQQLPDALAILNPKQSDCEFGFDMLAGVGVAFYLMIGIRTIIKKYKPDIQINLKKFLDFVAIGTIADMAPLTELNYILCKIGLDVLNQNLQEKRRPGIYALLKLAGWDDVTPVNARDIGFKIGPRLNAAGRLGNALGSVTLLRTNNTNEAENYAKFLHDENTERQILQKKMTEEALIMAKNAHAEQSHAVVLHKEDWHPGIIGLVASRVMEKYYKPTIILGTHNGKLKGSGRSTHAFDLSHALDQVRQEFVTFGGHYRAVGLTIEKEKLSWLQNYLNEQASLKIPPADKIPILFIDGILQISNLNEDFLSFLHSLEPFGQENPLLHWLIGPVQIRNIYRIGQDLSHGHAKVTLIDSSGSCSVTVFNHANIFEQYFETGIDLHVVVNLKKRIWKSKIYLDITVADFAPVVYLEQEKFQTHAFRQGIHHEYVI